MPLLLVLIFVLLLALTATVFMLNGLYGIFRTRIPYVPTADWAVGWLRKNLELPRNARVYDLGCGDGRVLAGLAERYPHISFIGLEVQWWPYVLARWRTRAQPNVRIERRDFWQYKISDATHIFCYLFAPILDRMRNKFESELRPGTNIISYGFRIPGWNTHREISDPQHKTKSRILFYVR